jgi:hypothetical protein
MDSITRPEPIALSSSPMSRLKASQVAPMVSTLIDNGNHEVKGERATMGSVVDVEDSLLEVTDYPNDDTRHAAPTGSSSSRKAPARALTSLQQDLVTKFAKEEANYVTKIVRAVLNSWNYGYLKAVVIWIVWLVAGTVFYAKRNKLGWGKGFYMMINVGYSIGWGYPVELDRDCEWFSAFNVLVGATALSFALKIFAESLLERAKDWYSIELYEKKMADRDVAWYLKAYEWCWAKRNELSVIIFFVMWVCFMVYWANSTYKDWMLVEGLYFAISSLSTGGMYPIPKNTDDYNFVIGK